MAPAVPDLLLGPSFTLLAVLLLAAAILTSLALVSVEMKPVRLYEAISAAISSEEEEEKTRELAEAGQGASSADAGHPKKRSKPRRLRLSKLKYFFLADRRSAPEPDDPHLLPDSAWVAPDPPCDDQKVEVFELPDEQWVSPVASQADER